MDKKRKAEPSDAGGEKKKAKTEEGDEDKEGNEETDATNKEKEAEEGEDDALGMNTKIATPKSLDQAYVIVPCKRRLVSLLAFLRWQQETNP